MAATIQNHLPDFTIAYQPDFRQAIADSWPRSIDDTPAKTDWSWEYQYGLSALTRDMLVHLAQKTGAPALHLSESIFF